MGKSIVSVIMAINQHSEPSQKSPTSEWKWWLIDEKGGDHKEILKN